jgi:polyhydroxybutyrate depolymerase
MRAIPCLLLLCACRATAPAVRLPATVATQPPRPSSGCAAVQQVPQGERKLTSGGRTRRFRLVLPDPIPSGPLPLVLNFHGLFEPPKLQQLLTGMDAEAKKRSMIVAYPEGVGTSWNAGSCCGRAQAEGIDDVRYARNLVTELASELCIDRNRIYATGMSNGAILSYRLACEASDVFAAVAPVDGVEAVPRCAPRRAVPVLAFNGMSDLLVRWDGGWFGLGAPRETVKRWSERDLCSTQTREIYSRGDARCEAAQGCAADVIFCTIDRGGHTWPGGMEAFFLGKTSSDLDATSAILDFFLDHPYSPISPAMGLSASIK